MKIWLCFVKMAFTCWNLLEDALTDETDCLKACYD